jgi:MoaA/NifB/PqqE/SkfB family radical SAM enzyme
MKVTVFPTNICNLTCKHCWRVWADWDKTYKSEVSDERLMQLVDEGGEMGVKEWYFVGGGDAMARGKLMMKMCARIRELGMNGTIHTNGTLFKPGMLEKLVEMGWERILVSLDGPDAEINDYIRGSGFEKATAMIRRLYELRKERGAAAPVLGIYSTITNMTYDKIDQFVELAHELQIDSGLHVSGLIAHEDPSDGAQEFELTPEQKSQLPEYIEIGMARANVLGVECQFEEYLNEELVHDGMDMHREFKPARTDGLAGAMCYEPWMSAAIMADGSLGPCCALYSKDALTIKDGTFEEIWEGAYMTKVREGILTGEPPDYCRRCPSNLYIHKERQRATLDKPLREARELSGMSMPHKAARMAKKGLGSIKRHGVLKTLRRGLEWRRLHGGLGG